jgi:hypothetical protein
MHRERDVPASLAELNACMPRQRKIKAEILYRTAIQV